MSQPYERPDQNALADLDQLFHHVAEELAGWRRRTLKAEAELQEARAHGGVLAGPELNQSRQRVIELEMENQALRQQEERKTPEERKTQATNGAGRDDREGRRKLEASAESVGAVTAPAASPTNQALEAGSSPAATSRAAAPAATPPPAAPAAKALDAASPARLRAFSNQSIEFTASIASPDPSIRWRIGRAGSIQYSSNGGVSWEPTATGVSVDLSAGSSPAPLVCWVVGRAGTVMLTVDGRRWQRVAFPENVDVIAVEASDARTALVRTAAGRAFRTADGGATWTLLQDF